MMTSCCTNNSEEVFPARRIASAGQRRMIMRLEAGQCTRWQRPQHNKMAELIFRCVPTGMNVQVWLPNMQPSDRTDSYEPVICPACSRLHLVNIATGKMLSDKEK